MIELGGEVAGGQTVVEVVGLDKGQLLYSLSHYWGLLILEDCSCITAG